MNYRLNTRVTGIHVCGIPNSKMSNHSNTVFLLPQRANIQIPNSVPRIPMCDIPLLTRNNVHGPIHRNSVRALHVQYHYSVQVVSVIKYVYTGFLYKNVFYYSTL